MWRWIVLVVAAYAVMSAVSFCLYGFDKRAARRGAWRVRERTLLRVDLLGGWPGGLVAQQVFRHKRCKRSFTLRHRGIVALHVAGWLVAAWAVVWRG